MNTKTKWKKIYFYSRFERLNHWLQALLVITLGLTGFEMHGTYSLFGFEEAYEIHNFCAWTWLTLFIFDIFYLVVTNEWKQYTPTLKRLMSVVRYYMIGIFKGDEHPVPKSEREKHNPLQRLTYLSIVSVLIPFQMITGFLYYYYNDWGSLGLSWSLKTMAVLHTIGAFAFISFVVVHVYMTTTGHTFWSHIRAMFTGYEEVKDNGNGEDKAAAGA